MKSFRLERVENIIFHQVGSLIISGKIKDYRVNPMITVTRVKVAKDLSSATVWVSVLGDSDKVDVAVEGLKSAAGFIQSFLARHMKTRFTPKLHFKADHSIEESMRVQNKIKDLFSDD